MKTVTDGQQCAINSLLSECGVKEYERIWILSRLIDREIETSSDVRVSEWQDIRDEAFPNWTKDDWTTCEAFRRRVKELRRKYEHEVMGQKQMF